MLLGQLSFYGLLCVAGALGACQTTIGFYALMFPITLMLGALQANQRALFGNLAPVGKESAMFAFYTITDKGSSLIGAFVTVIVHTYTGSYLGVFWYCVIAFVLSAMLLYFVD